MGKGFSQLQKEILAVLEQWPALEELSQGKFYNFKLWARPRDIIRELGRPETLATRVAVSRSLLRLCQRGVVARESAEVANVGNAFFYARISSASKATGGDVTLITAAHAPAK